MTHHGSRGMAAAVITALIAAPAVCARAQVSTADQRCLTGFNKSVRDVARAHGVVVRTCLQDFARGRLVRTSPELCVRSDARGTFSRAVTRAAGQVEAKCPAPPAFGVTDVESALVRSVLGQLDLAHAGLGPDLDTALTATAARCQSRVTAALLRCADTRLRAFLKCQQRGLRAGTITDGPSLAAACLGSGTESQPDPSGTIAANCNARLTREVAQQCLGTDLATAFPPCAAEPSVAGCLDRASACAVCLVMRDVDGLERDCDLFDDGDNRNGTCGSECGDGVLQQGEACDDGGVSDADGCSARCTLEGGWTCAGQPSVCTENCGNGVLDAGETCDDGGRAAGDGCSARCETERGFQCTGEPSVCRPRCGNGALDAGEACDDGGGAGGDGCSATCQIEPGYACSGEPSTCAFVCGNGSFDGGETCDDGNAGGGDGCSPVCRVEPGWLCAGSPSFCVAVCGDGLRRGAEACDDGNAGSGDGCAFNCQVEAGFQCSGATCRPVCGDGFVRGDETCDDGNTTAGDGCSAPFCRREPGYACAGQPSTCAALCGNGIVDPLEGCDDGGTAGGDGCSASCQPEPGFACGGQPSLCLNTCGNNVLDADEECDDGNRLDRDGCSASCRNESGWLCRNPGQPCQPFAVSIDSPAHGSFSQAASVQISGHYTALLPGHVSVTVNGAPADAVNQTQRTFSHTLPLNPTTVFTPVHVVVANTDTGDRVHDRIVVIAGAAVADGDLAPESVAMRVNDSGLDTLEPLVGGLAAGQLDLATMLPPGTEILNECFLSIIGCWGRARVRIANPSPSFNNLTVAFDAKTGAVFGDIGVDNLRIDVDIDGSGLVPDCGLRLTADHLRLTGDYALQPQPGQPARVDVNLVTPMGVTFTGFHHRFTYGLCNAFLIGDIIQALLPDIQSVAVNGIRDLLSDPDGAGPEDSPIADAIEATLAGVSISGAVGSGLGLTLDAPLFDVAEDNDGVTLGADSRFTASVGPGPGQCLPPPGAPDFTASYARLESFPSFSPFTPEAALPYGVGIAISTSGFNQLLRGQTECGLLRTSLSSIDLDGAGGAPPLPLTAGLLALVVPEMGRLPADTPLRIDVTPTLAPIVTGSGGPNGELSDLRIAQVLIDIVAPGPETRWLGAALDTRLGLDLDFLPGGSGLAIVLGEPALADIAVTIIDNPLGADEAQVEAVLPAVIRPLIPELAGALSGFPLPQFLGLRLAGVEVSRSGEFLSLFANLEQP